MGMIDRDSCLWEAPVAKPDDGQVYTWDEQTTSWNLLGDSE